MYNNVQYMKNDHMPREGEGRKILKAKIKQYCQRDSYDEYVSSASIYASASGCVHNAD